MVLGKLPVPGRPTILMIVGQGPIALAVGAGGGCFLLDIFALLYPFSPLSPSLGDGPIYTEILSQRTAKPKTTTTTIILVNTETQRMQRNKYSAVIYLTCKGEKIANAGYLENIADLCKSYNLYEVE